MLQSHKGTNTHWSRNALNAPLPSSLLHFTFLFYTLLFFFLLLPTILVHRQGTLVPKEKQWTSELLECFLLTQAVTLAFDEQVTDWGTGRIYVCFIKSSWSPLILIDISAKKSDGQDCTLLQWVTFLLPIS